MADWTCSNCNWVNRDFAEACLSCGQARPSATATSPPAGAPERPWDLGPVSPQLALSDPLPAMPAATPAWFRTDGLLGGLAVAALAAVAASAAWYAVVAFSSYQVGFVAAAVGWVVGTGALLGARQRGSLWLAAGSGLLTLGALIVSEYLISYHFVTQELGIVVELLQPADFVLAVVVDVLAADPLTLVFWGFALVVAVYVPFKAIVSRSG